MLARTGWRSCQLAAADPRGEAGGLLRWAAANAASALSGSPTARSPTAPNTVTDATVVLSPDRWPAGPRPRTGRAQGGFRFHRHRAGRRPTGPLLRPGASRPRPSNGGPGAPRDRARRPRDARRRGQRRPRAAARPTDALLTLGRTRAAGESALSAMAASEASGAACERAEAHLVSGRVAGPEGRAGATDGMPSRWRRISVSLSHPLGRADG